MAIGVDLFGKTIGIIGFGEIGKRIARIARGFRMTILVNDPYIDLRAARQEGARSVELADLIRESDIITIHVPLTPATKSSSVEKNSE